MMNSYIGKLKTIRNTLDLAVWKIDFDTRYRTYVGALEHDDWLLIIDDGTMLKKFPEFSPYNYVLALTKIGPGWVRKTYLFDLG